MMGQFFLTQGSRNDLVSIRDYTTEYWGERQSVKYLAKMKESLLLLANNPFMVARRADIDDESFSFPYESHMIYYKLNNGDLLVFAVLHKIQIPSNHLDNRL